MQRIHSFPPLAKAHARILILGSMPGVASLDAYEYYAHPRNAFWTMVDSVFNIDRTLNYEMRCQRLTEHGIAVWDVLKSCHRAGSLDSDIEKDSIVANDFTGFLHKHAHINNILFNGGMAEKSFNTHVKKNLLLKDRSLKYYRLPSTSPAHAAMTLEEKVNEWSSVLQSCLNT